jgi:NodT family efflux transporter outer membrane factor (OMF) lipoprotein
MKKFITLICVAALTAGCGIYKPYSRPDVDMSGLYGAEHETQDTLSMADVEWREFFTDSHLQRLISQALEQNADMQSAYWRIEEAEAALKSARLAFIPSFNLAPNGGVSSFANSSAAWSYTAPISASWQIDIFGGLRNAKRKAQATYAQSKEYRQAVRTQLIAAVANFYYTLLMLDESYEVTLRTAESLDASAEAMRSMMSAGMTNLAGVAQMEAAAFAARASLNDIELQIRQVENSLSLLLFETPQSIERGKLDEQQLPETIATGVPLRMLSNRPDVRMAEYGLMQSYYATAAARSALYPSLKLEGVIGWTNNVGSIITNPGGLILSAAASLTAPIFNGGKLRAQLRIAEAQQQEAALSFRQALLNAGAEVNNALAAVQTARAKRELRAKQIESLQSAAESTQLLMQYGSTTYLEVLTAQQELLAGQLSEIGDRYDEIEAMVSLYTSLGGGRESDTEADASLKSIKEQKKSEKKNRKRK